MGTLSAIFVQSLLIVLLLGSLAGVAVGVGLLVRAERALVIFRRLNHWFLSDLDLKARRDPAVTARKMFEPRQRRFVGLIFLIGGCLGATLIASATAHSESPIALIGGELSVISGILVEALRWFLLVGCVAALMMGVMLLFFPGAWVRLEARANRWYSTERFFAQGDAMHLPLEGWIERSPRPAGALIAMLSLVAVVAFAGLLLWRS